MAAFDPGRSMILVDTSVIAEIKPENLLLDKEGRAKIADFGIAKMVGSERSTQY